MDKLRDKIEQDLYCEMCRCCPRAKKCHEECENCEEYETELEKQLKKVGIDLC